MFDLTSQQVISQLSRSSRPNGEEPIWGYFRKPQLPLVGTISREFNHLNLEDELEPLAVLLEENPLQDLGQFSASILAHYCIFQRTGKPQHLDAAITTSQKDNTAAKTPQKIRDNDLPFFAIRERLLRNHTVMLLKRFMAYKSAADLKEAMESAKELVGMTSLTDPHRFPRWEGLCRIIIGYSSVTGDDKPRQKMEADRARVKRNADKAWGNIGRYFPDLKSIPNKEGCVNALKEVFVTIPMGKSRALTANSISNISGFIWIEKNDPDALDDAISFGGLEIQGVLLESIEAKATQLIAHSSYLLSRFQHAQGSIDDLNRGINETQIALLLGVDRERRRKGLVNLCNSLALRYSADRETWPEDLDLSDRILKRLLNYMPRSPDEIEVLVKCLCERLRRSPSRRSEWAAEDLKTLEKAIKIGENLAKKPESHSESFNMFTRLSDCFAGRYTLSKDADDMNQASAFLERTLLHPFRGHENRIDNIAELVDRYVMWDWETKDGSTVEKILPLVKELLSQTGADINKRAKSISISSDCLLDLFLSTGDTGYLRQVIQVTEEFFSTGETLDLGLRYTRQCKIILARAYINRHVHVDRSELGDIEEAIRILYDVFGNLSYRDIEFQRVCYFLSRCHRLRFECDKSKYRHDVDLAIEYGKAATEQPGRTLPAVIELADAMSARGVFHKSLEDINGAISISLARTAVCETGSGTQIHAEVKYYLAWFLIDKQAVSPELEDFIAIVRIGRALLDDQAVDILTRLRGAIHALNYLGPLGRIEDLIKICPSAARGLVHIPEDAHRDLELSGQLDIRDDVKEGIVGTVAIPVANSDLEAMKMIMSESELNRKVYDGLDHGRLQEMEEVAMKAVYLLPELNITALEQRDRQERMMRLWGLGRHALAIAFAAKRSADRCLELSEFSRNIIDGLRFRYRPDLTALHEKHPKLAVRFVDARDELDREMKRSSPVPASVTGIQNDDLSLDKSLTRPGVNAQKKQYLKVKLNEIIEEIRMEKGFDRFLLLPRSEELKAVSRSPKEAIVIINTYSYRCDAIIVQNGEIRHLPLPRLHLKEIEKNARDMQIIRGNDEYHLQKGSGGPGQYTDSICRVLQWLWTSMAEEILNFLGFKSTPSRTEEWPRIWWIPTGPLTQLPLHAAGYYSSGRPADSVVDRAVSSYISSIKALLYLRQHQKERDLNQTANGILLAAMRNTESEGFGPLRFAGEEIEIIKKAFVNSAQVSAENIFQLYEPSKGELKNRLSSCAIFHFAGHGMADDTDPSQSRLVLRDYESDPFTAQNLIDLDLYEQSPWLAYLSACSTGENKNRNLHDESIHLMSACQTAGFQNVIGSLWEISDWHSSKLACEVYKNLMKELGSSKANVAFALHKAIRGLRELTTSNSQTRSLGGKQRHDQLVDEWGNMGTDTSGEELNIPELDDCDNTEGHRGIKSAKVKLSAKSTLGNPLIWAAYIHVGV